MRKRAFGENKKSLLDKVIEKVRITKVRQLIGPARHVVDLGCGYHAELLHLLLPSLQSAVGVDLSVGVSRSPKLKLLNRRVDDQLPLQSSKYELVTALAIIEHVESPETMLLEACRILQPDGRIVVTTPSLMGKWPLEIMAKFGLISHEEIADHKRYYTRTSLKLALKEAGFKKVVVKHFGIMWLNLVAVGVK